MKSIWQQEVMFLPGREAQARGIMPTPACPLAAWSQSFQHPLAHWSGLLTKVSGIGVL